MLLAVLSLGVFLTIPREPHCCTGGGGPAGESVAPPFAVVESPFHKSQEGWVPPMTVLFEQATALDTAVDIRVAGLCKTYVVGERAGGLGAALRGAIRRTTREVRAVDAVSFSIAPGEIVGFLGANGAGKTTTLKMLAGLLHPTAGSASVLGHVPWQREHPYLRQMTLIMGQRNQLLWDLPALDSLLVNRAIYRLTPQAYGQMLDELTALLDLGPLLGKQVRQLSLGERMKCEFAAALLHRPRVLFLDEPTIGLDVTAQGRIRAFIREYNRRVGATVLLTSHYMADVTALAKRVIVIHQGKLLFDGALAGLAERLAPFKIVQLDLEEGARRPQSWEAYGEALPGDDGKVRLRVAKARAPEVTARLLSDFAVADLTIEDPPIEDVIDQVFRGEAL
jgi:ABC-2 type transport system ATP-binding protein